jgi:hypothetical protein
MQTEDLDTQVGCFQEVLVFFLTLWLTQCLSSEVLEATFICLPYAYSRDRSFLLRKMAEEFKLYRVLTSVVQKFLFIAGGNTHKLQNVCIFRSRASIRSDISGA